MKPNDLIEIQALFLKWMRHHSVRSSEQIRMACNSLLLSFGTETKSSLFKIFYPLLRRGLVEFIGDGNYIVTAPVILFYKKQNIAVAVNLTKNQHEQLLESVAEIVEDVFGMIRFNFDKQKVLSISKEIDCNYFEPNSSDILSNFPNIKAIVFNQFEKAHITFSGEYYNVINHKWAKDSLQKSGVFRISADAQKFYLRTDNEDFHIPSFTQNPDGRPIAETFQAINANIVFCRYDRCNAILTISDLNIPILIDRILRLSSLHQENGVVEDYFKTIYSNISPSVFKQIIRIFDKHIHIP